MAPMERLGSASPIGTQAGAGAPKLYDRHIPPPDMETITCVASAGFTRMPLIRPESTAGYCTAFHSKAAVLGPTLTQEGAVTSENGPMPCACRPPAPGISGAQRTDSW